VNSFLKKCRREWKRLHVPEAIANEMAADLEADLKEAEADGASLEEVLGTAVFDPPAFAASWAAERGVIPPPATSSKSGLNGRTPFVIAGVTLALIAALGAGMVIASHVGATRLEAIDAAGPGFSIHAALPCQRMEVRLKQVLATPCAGLQPGSTIVQPGQVPFPPGQRPATIVKPPVLHFFRPVLGSARLSSVGWTLIVVGAGGLVLLSVLSWVLGRRQRRRAPVPA